MKYIQKFESRLEDKLDISDIVESFIQGLNFEHLTHFLQSRTDGFDIYINKDTRHLLPLDSFTKSMTSFENRIDYIGYKVSKYKIITEKGGYVIRTSRDETIIQNISSLNHLSKIEDIGYYITSILITVVKK